MSIKFLSFLAGVAMIVPVAGFAATNEEAINALQAQIQALRQQISNLLESRGSPVREAIEVRTFPLHPDSPSVNNQPGDEPPLTSTITFDRDLYYGLRNDVDVSNLQEFLIDQGFLKGVSSGNYFLLTQKAVQQFQSAHGLRPTGYFGPLTRAVANKILAGIGSGGGGGGILSISQPFYSVEPTGPFMRGQRYDFNAKISNGKPNAQVLFFLQRPDGSMKYNGIACLGSNIGTTKCALYTDASGSLQTASYELITTEGQNGTWVSWMTVGGVQSNKQSHVVVGQLSSRNLPPIISGLKGPTALQAGEKGTWTIEARDPENGSLAYHITWGDEEVGIARARQSPLSVDHIAQTAAFTHVYTKAGTFAPLFVVVDEGNLSAQTSASLVVGGGTVGSIKPMVLSDIQQIVSVTPASVANLSFGVREVNAQYNLGAYHQGKWYEGLNPGISDAVWVEFGWPNTPEVDIVLLDQNGRERKMYLPAVGTNASTFSWYYWIAEDGSSYYAHTSHGPGWANMTRSQALTPEHLARRAGTGTSPQPSLTVLTPNGGETWTKGTTQTIKWQGKSCPIGANCILSLESYDIKLASYYPPCTSNICPAYPYIAPYMIANAVYGSSYSWSVGKILNTGDIAPDGSYTIQICQTGSQICDSSDSYFKIISGGTGTNNYPIINSIPAIPSDIKVGQSVSLSWGATDADGDNLSWTVSWGDGTGTVGACAYPNSQNKQNWTFNMSHTWQQAGTYPVKVTADDCRGGSAVHTFNIVVSGTVAGIDFTVENVQLPVSAVVDKEVILTFDIINRGNETFFWQKYGHGVQWTVDYLNLANGYDTAGRIISDGCNTSIELVPGAGCRVSAGYTFKNAGVKTLPITADYAKQVQEINEDNNTVKSAITVSAPNYDACRLDKLDGSNITKRAIEDQTRCLIDMCDVYGPANLNNGIESDCVFQGKGIKRYTNARVPVVNVQAYPDSATPAPSDGPLTVAYGQSVTVTWKTENAASCTASGNWPNFTGTKALQGSESTAPNNAGSYTATLTCSSNLATISDSITISVASPSSTPVPTSSINSGSNARMASLVNTLAVLQAQLNAIAVKMNSLR